MTVPRAALLSGLLPRNVIGEVLLGDAAPEPLFDQELKLVASAVPGRQREFAAGRTCARRALARLGAPAGALLRDDDRVPLWPAGTCGSITHTSGFCAAVVASARAFVGIGIDAEPPIRADLEPVLGRICRAAEIAWLDRYAGLERQWRAALVFSAKESLYKCVFPSTRRWLDFHDAELDVAGLDGESGALSLEVRHRSAPVSGRFALRGNLVITVVAMASDGGDRGPAEAAGSR